MEKMAMSQLLGKRQKMRKFIKWNNLMKMKVLGKVMYGFKLIKNRVFTSKELEALQDRMNGAMGLGMIHGKGNWNYTEDQLNDLEHFTGELIQRRIANVCISQTNKHKADALATIRKWTRVQQARQRCLTLMYGTIFNRMQRYFLGWKRKAHLSTEILKEKCNILVRTLTKQMSNTVNMGYEKIKNHSKVQSWKQYLNSLWKWRMSSQESLLHQQELRSQKQTHDLVYLAALVEKKIFDRKAYFFYIVRHRVTEYYNKTQTLVQQLGLGAEKMMRSMFYKWKVNAIASENEKYRKKYLQVKQASRIFRRLVLVTLQQKAHAFNHWKNKVREMKNWLNKFNMWGNYMQNLQRSAYELWRDQKKNEEKMKLAATNMFNTLSENQVFKKRVALYQIKLLSMNFYKLRRMILSLNQVFLNQSVGVWFSRWHLKTVVSNDEKKFKLIQNLLTTWKQQTLQSLGQAWNQWSSANVKNAIGLIIGRMNEWARRNQVLALNKWRGGQAFREYNAKSKAIYLIINNADLKVKCYLYKWREVNTNFKIKRDLIVKSVAQHQVFTFQTAFWRLKDQLTRHPHEDDTHTHGKKIGNQDHHHRRYRFKRAKTLSEPVSQSILRKFKAGASMGIILLKHHFNNRKFDAFKLIQYYAFHIVKSQNKSFVQQKSDQLFFKQKGAASVIYSIMDEKLRLLKVQGLTALKYTKDQQKLKEQSTLYEEVLQQAKNKAKRLNDKLKQMMLQLEQGNCDYMLPHCTK